MSPRIADLGDMEAIVATLGPAPRFVEKACGCGALEGDQCDCAEINAEWQAAMARPIYWSQTGGAWTAAA